VQTPNTLNIIPLEHTNRAEPRLHSQCYNTLHHNNKLQTVHPDSMPTGTSSHKVVLIIKPLK
jgi:hypothetical protein